MFRRKLPECSEENGIHIDSTHFTAQMYHHTQCSVASRCIHFSSFFLSTYKRFTVRFFFLFYYFPCFFSLHFFFTLYSFTLSLFALAIFNFILNIHKYNFHKKKKILYLHVSTYFPLASRHSMCWQLMMYGLPFFSSSSLCYAQFLCQPLHSIKFG